MHQRWDAGLIYWQDHRPAPTERYSLAHLHPSKRQLLLEAYKEFPATEVLLHVSFGLHTFTRACESHDHDARCYQDNRETRTFDLQRYARSHELPGIIGTLETRRCEFSRDRNGIISYVTVETSTGDRYAVFFDLRLLRKIGPNAVHLTVKSAYVLEPGKPAPGRGRIKLNTLIGHALRGTKPRPP